jgi:hypothetical protein
VVATVGAVVVSTAAASVVAVSAAAVLVVGSTGEASAVVVSVGDISAAVAFAVAILVGGITDSLMMSSSAASAFRGGGAGTIRTDITVTAITRTVIMDTAGTHTATGATGHTVTTAAPVTGIAMEAARVMDMAVAAEPVTDPAMAPDQGISRLCGVGDKHGRLFGERPFRVHIDPTEDGAEVVNAVSHRVRAELFVGSASLTCSHSGTLESNCKARPA